MESAWKIVYEVLIEMIEESVLDSTFDGVVREIDDNWRSRFP